MINKIQKYMLTHYPTVWNMRIIPMLLLMAGIHLLFFVIAYISEDTIFNNGSYYYNQGDNIYIIYVLAIMVSSLLLIGWLLIYNRNNSLKSLYPRKVITIYGEWFFSFILLLSLTLLPITVDRAATIKWQTTTSEKDKLEALNLLDKVSMLIPNSCNYSYKANYQTPIHLKNQTPIHISEIDSVSLKNYMYIKDGDKIILTDYIGASLIYYAEFPRKYYTLLAGKMEDDFSDDSDFSYRGKVEYTQKDYDKVIALEQIKSYLINGEKDKIVSLLKEYETLLNYHKNGMDATPEEWADLIFSTAPTFDISNLIYDYSSERLYSHNKRVYNNYDNVNSLQSSYQNILYNYESKEISNKILSCLYIALCISVLIFSYRVTSRKSWLIAIVSLGVLLFIFGLLSIISSINSNSGPIPFLSMCVLTLLGAITIVFIKISSKDAKGKFGDSILNISLWAVPSVIPLLYGIADYSYYKHLSVMFWCSLLFSIVIMYVMCNAIKKFRGLADE